MAREWEGQGGMRRASSKAGFRLALVGWAAAFWLLLSLAHVEVAFADDPSRADPCAGGVTRIEDYVALYSRQAVDPRFKGLGFRHLIALVPDPVDAARSGSFDTVLEGIEEAVAGGPKPTPSAPATHYVRDRGWFPWPTSGATKKEDRCWKTQPGVLIYRPTVATWLAPTYLVFLVGETPTWGVRAKQLESALGLVDRFAAWEDNGGDEREVRILGPTFSGTAPSLAAVLRKRSATPFGAVGLHLSYRIVSGTATNVDVKSTLEGPSETTGGASTSFEVMTPTDDKLLGAMLTFLSVRGATCAETPDPANVVLFTEGLTAYGAGAGHGPSASALSCFQVLKFPPDLPAIRDAYSSEAESEGAGAPSRPATEGANDTPLAYSLALGEVLRDLSRTRTRFVGLVATNPHDVIALADLIHAQLPDIRLFTLGGDIRYVDPIYANALDGMLVAHAAPDPNASMASVSLASEVVRGVYSAGRRLLENEGSELPVQISLVGHGALWQIGPDGTAADSMSGTQVSGLTVKRVPVGWTFVLVLFVLIFGIVTVGVLSPSLTDLARRHWHLDPSKTTGFL